MNNTDFKTQKSKPFLLYFNDRDTLTYKRTGGLLTLKDTFAILPFYWKGEYNEKFTSTQGMYYRIGPRHAYIQNEKNIKHKKKYLPKDSFQNYDIVKVPWKGFNIDILDVSNKDSAFIVTVNSDTKIE